MKHKFLTHTLGAASMAPALTLYDWDLPQVARLVMISAGCFFLCYVILSLRLRVTKAY
jgi:phosphatidylserine synthase